MKKLIAIVLFLFTSKLLAAPEMIIGGFDPDSVASADKCVKSLEQAMPQMKKLGVTSHEGYVRWNLCEPREGEFDWTVYDKFVEVYKKNHIKWVPFIICGSAYSVPDWYYKKPGSQGYVCLEHGETCDVESLWNPNFRPHVERFLKAFCEHYRDSGVIEAMLLGVTGNYGEAIYPASGNDWTANAHGKYHTHAGYWAGDPYAVKDFQATLAKKYGQIEKLNIAWRASFKSFDEIQPFLREKAPNDRAWIDFYDWYRDSMTQWAGFWMRTTRANFPGEIYLCTGGDATPMHGSDFGEQCRIAAEVHGGVRITNESSDYALNFAVTRWVASAGRQYGAYYSFEPAGTVNPAPGVVARVYNAAASGVHGLHWYWPNLAAAPATENFLTWKPMLDRVDPVNEIAVYYPSAWIALRGQKFIRPAMKLRDRFDFDFLSDGMIRDGGLKRSKVLVFVSGDVVAESVWSEMQNWVKNGGLLLMPDSLLPLHAVDGKELAAIPNAIVFHGKADSDEYADFLCQSMQNEPKLSAETRAMLSADGKRDGVFVSAAKNKLLWLNPTSQPVQRTVEIPAMSIVEQPIDKP